MFLTKENFDLEVAHLQIFSRHAEMNGHLSELCKDTPISEVSIEMLQSMIEAHLEKRIGDRFTGSVAVVGNGSVHHRKPKGQEIDGYDHIIRMNNATVSGFEQKVGSRTELRVVNEIIAKQLILDPTLYKDEEIIFFNPTFRGYLTVLYCWWYAVSVQKRKAWVIAPSVRSNMDNSYGLSNPSTGFMGALLGKQLFDTCRLYGYNRDGDTNHYYKPEEGSGLRNFFETSYHKIHIEQSYYEDWVMGSGDFTWDELDPSSFVDRDFYQREGYLKIDGVLNDAEVKHWRNQVVRVAPNVGAGRTDMVSQDPSFWPLIFNPNILKVMDSIVGDTAVWVQHSDVKNGGFASIWHRDSAWRKQGEGRCWKNNYMVIRVIVILDDTKDNGYFLELQPGTHDNKAKSQPVQIHAKAGDLIVFDQRLLHKGIKPSGDKRTIYLGYGARNEHSKDHRGYYLNFRTDLGYQELNSGLKALLEKEGRYISASNITKVDKPANPKGLK